MPAFRPSMPARQRQLLLLALSAALQCSVAAVAGAVPCASLPELKEFSLKVAILGNCSDGKDEDVSLQTLGGSASQRWIVAWRPEAAGTAPSLSSEACAEGEAADAGRFNASCTHRYAAALPGFAARFSRKQLASFLRAYSDRLSSVAPDTPVSLRGPVSVSGGDLSSGVHATAIDAAKWGLDRLDQRSLPLDGRYQYYSTGRGVNVYILDTGIRASHHEFAHSDGSAGTRAGEVFAAPSLDPAGAGLDCEGHGTHVAGVVGGLTFGVAKDARLNALRILDCQGNGAVSDVLLALDWLKLNAQRPAVVSMSLGGEVQLQLDEAVRSLTQEGIHVVVAAGNEDIDACDTSPAREGSAVTVGATDASDRRLWLAPGKASNYGECVDLFAPGTDILSAGGSSDAAQQLRTGTSQAVPFVAGVMALILQNSTSAKPADLQRLLAASAASGQLTEVPGSGFGSLDASNSPNLLLQSSVRAPIKVSPASLGPIDGASAGPFTFSVALGQAPLAEVQLELAVDASRGSLQPSSLRFGPDDWSRPQAVKLSVSPFASTASAPLAVTISSTSADNLFVASQTAFSLVDFKGDTLQYPRAVMALPFSESGTTGEGGGAHYQDNYSVVCGEADGDQGGSPDVVYYFRPATDCTVTASLCGSSALADTFDSRLYLLADVDKGGVLQAAACSNDACGVLPSLTASLKAGVGYAFVVDGVGGASGHYSISITAAEGRVTGGLPPASLLQASVSVASLGPAAGATGSGSAGFTTEASADGSRYWLLGPWSSCSPQCMKTRKVACYSASGAPLPAAQCADLQRPPSQQACSGCTVSANSTVEGSSGGGGSNSAVIIAACSAGAALAVGAALGAFLLLRRRRQRAAGQQAPQPGKRSACEEEGVAECIPLPKQLPPIATGRGRARSASARASPRAHVTAAAGAAASAHQLHQQGSGYAAAAAAQLQGRAPDYHVVHMPSPRLPGQDTGSPSGLRRSLRQRSPTRRPHGASARATPDAAGPGEHRLARSSSSAAYEA